jgi:Protein of unknown function (DUF3106)
MKGKSIQERLAATFLAMVALASPCLAQKNAPRPTPAPRAQLTNPDRPRQQGHAGDWLRRYKDLPPEEQEHELQNDPVFRRLPAARQQILRQRLQHFSSLPPEKQLQMLNRMETWEHLTPEQKQQARQVFSQFRQLPPERRRLVRKAVEDLRTMPPGQREQIIDSDRFKGMFSDPEREMIRGASRLPLAPAEENGPQE